jgi:hypothetical protein
MENFSVIADPDASPYETTSHSRRLKVSWQGRPIIALSQGIYRPYIYPVFTPAGVLVTAEAPVDHPHHQSITAGTDYLDLYRASHAPGGATPNANYNFYMDEAFRGRAPGRILTRSTQSTEVDENHLRLVQRMDWQSPQDWANADGTTLVEETRIVDVYPGEVANIIDVRSRLLPTAGDIRIGGTVHGHFVVRLADGLRPVDGGTLTDSTGRTGATQVRGQYADWVDSSGSAAHGHKAGVALFPYPGSGDVPWHLSDWGFMMVNPFQVEARQVNKGDTVEVAMRVVAHDGDVNEAGVAALYASFVKDMT